MVDLYNLALGDIIIQRIQSLFFPSERLLALGRTSICFQCPRHPPQTTLDYTPACHSIYQQTLQILTEAIRALYEHARVFALYEDIQRLLCRVPRQELQLYFQVVEITRPPDVPDWIENLRSLPRDTDPPSALTWAFRMGGVGGLYTPSIPHCLDRDQPFVVARVGHRAADKVHCHFVNVQRWMTGPNRRAPSDTSTTPATSASSSQCPPLGSY